MLGKTGASAQNVSSYKSALYLSEYNFLAVTDEAFWRNAFDEYYKVVNKLYQPSEYRNISNEQISIL